MTSVCLPRNPEYAGEPNGTVRYTFILRGVFVSLDRLPHHIYQVRLQSDV
jgi:hypothetical protein